jgi:hypothetical protein
MASVQQHGCNRTDLHANLGMVVQAGKGGDRAAAGHCQPYAAAVIGFGDPQTAFGLRLGIGDRVEEDIAVRPEGLRGDDDPLCHQGDTQRLGKRLAELNLKTRRVPCFAGIGQGIGMSAQMERAGGSDHL